MDTQTNPAAVDFENRLARSSGRSGRTYVASAKVTGAEQDELISAAQLEGKALSEWSREVLLREARRMNGDPVFTEIIATRTLLNKVLRKITLGQGMTTEQFNAMQDEIRTTKHATAREVMEQYTPSTEKEK